MLKFWQEIFSRKLVYKRNQITLDWHAQVKILLKLKFTHVIFFQVNFKFLTNPHQLTIKFWITSYNVI